MTSHRPKHPHPADIIQQALSGICLTLAILCLIQFTYMYWGNGLDVDTTSQRLETASKTHVQTPRTDKTGRLRTTNIPTEHAATAEGQLLGYLRIPAFGVTWRKPIQQGTDKTVLDNMGVGHYANTAMAGQPGNASYAGHRAPSDLGYMNQLHEGDQIIIETAANWYVYRVNTNPYVVHMTQTNVINPDAAHATRGLTLTTCEPMGSLTPAVDRLILHATFTGWMPKTDGVPQSLATTHMTATDHINRTVTTVSKQVDMPVTGVLALTLAITWTGMEAILWLLCYKRMARVWSTPTFSPTTLLWRLQAGPVPYDPNPRFWRRQLERLPSAIIRLTAFAIMWTAIAFACYHWGVCEWVIDKIPALQTQNPSIG